MLRLSLCFIFIFALCQRLPAAQNFNDSELRESDDEASLQAEIQNHLLQLDELENRQMLLIKNNPIDSEPRRITLEVILGKKQMLEGQISALEKLITQLPAEKRTVRQTLNNKSPEVKTPPKTGTSEKSAENTTRWGDDLAKALERLKSVFSKNEKSPVGECRCDLNKKPEVVVKAPPAQTLETAKDLQGEKCSSIKFTATETVQKRVLRTPAEMKKEIARARSAKDKKSKKIERYKLVSVDETRTYRENTGYLEGTLKHLYPQTDLDFKPAGPDDIAHGCMLEAQKSAPARGLYAKCPGPHSIPERSLAAIKPCVTERYHNLIYNNFTNVMNCFGVDQKTIFPLVTTESHFIMNSFSQNSAGGLGQFNQSGISEVNEKFFQDANTIFSPQVTSLLNRDGMQSELSKKACASVQKSFNSTVPSGHASFHPFSEDVADRCETVVTPQNPLESLIYLALYQKINEQYIDLFFKMPNLGLSGAPKDEIFFVKGRTLEEQLRPAIGEESFLRLKKVLSVLSYNAGPGTVALTLRTYLWAKHGKIRKDDFDFTHPREPSVGDPGNFVSYIARNLNAGFYHDNVKKISVEKIQGAGRRKEAADYLPKMLATALDIEKDVATQRSLTFVAPSPKQAERSHSCIDPTLY